MGNEQVEIALLMATGLDALEIDPRLRKCSMTFTQTSGESRTTHVLTASGIKLFRSFNDYGYTADEDSVLEATHVLSQAGDDRRLFIECWGPDAGIEVVARWLVLDGVSLRVENAGAFPNHWTLAWHGPSPTEP